jgi:hypothetical protein
MDLRFSLRLDGARAVELGSGEDVETAKLMVVKVSYRVEEITVQGHQATDNGANNLLVVRRSVKVHPCGGVIRSAWLAHRE